jgi:hypothetical protein
MKIKINHYWLVPLSVLALAQPVLAMCLGDLLPDYIKNPAGTTTPGTVLAGCQLALVKIVAVHPDAKPSMPNRDTGTLVLRKIESTKVSLPMTFSVPYAQRHMNVMIDCDTWDFIVLKPGKELLAFFRPVPKGWSIPLLGASGIVNNVDRMTPAEKKQVQPFFRTRL